MKINTTSILVALLATTSTTLAASCPDPTLQPRNGIFNRLKFYAENLYPNGYQSCASSLDGDANAAYMAQQQQQAAHYGDDALRVPMMKAEAGKGSRDSKMVVLGVVGAAGVFALGML